MTHWTNRTAAVAALLVACSATLHAEVREAVVHRIADDVNYLASDALEGRGVESEGNRKAIDHIRTTFEAVGIKGGLPDGSYLQPFSVRLGSEVVADQTSFTVRGPDGQTLPLTIGTDYRPLSLGTAGTVKAAIVFAGYGIAADDLGYDDYTGADVQGKIVVILRKEPQQTNEASVFDGKETTKHAYLHSKLEAALKHGAAAVLLVNDPTTFKADGKDELVGGGTFGNSGGKLPFAQVTQEVVNKMLAASPLTAGDTKLSSLADIETHIDATLTPLTQELADWTADLTFTFNSRNVEVANVIGIVEGEGPLAAETIVVGAHLDHIGYGEIGSRGKSGRAIHNGADDNASGTSAMLELARRVAAGPKPARRVVFIGFNGEERGLLGSNYYVEHPVYPLETTVAMLNFDMVGRLGESPLIIYGTGTATEFATLIDDVGKRHDAIETKPVPGVQGNSDHFGFVQKKVPAFHFFTGLSKEYHTPEDDVETLNLPGIAATVDFAEDVLRTILDRPAPTYVQVPIKTGGGRGDMAYFGAIPDYAGDANGLKLNGVSEGSPADAAGFKAGDIITRFGEIDVADIQGLADGLRKYKAGERVSVVVRRGDSEQTLEVVLGEPKASPR